MPLYLPRRYRRRLLFPPGLLALAGLLWLGCVALGPWQERLKLKSVMQLTMPPILALSPAEAKTCLFCAPNLSKRMHAMGPWHKNYLTGRSENQSQERARATTAIRAMMADSSHRGRVSISLNSTACYKDLVFLLDLMNRENTQKYWLDTGNKPVTLYAFTDVRRRNDYENNGFICGTVYTRIYPAIPSIPFWEQLSNWGTDFWDPTWLQPLLQPEWRVSAWFLAAIVALSGWGIIRPWRATQAL